MKSVVQNKCFRFLLPLLLAFGFLFSLAGFLNSEAA
jgi:hypothetical protein